MRREEKRKEEKRKARKFQGKGRGGPTFFVVRPTAKPTKITTIQRKTAFNERTNERRKEGKDKKDKKEGKSYQCDPNWDLFEL